MDERRLAAEAPEDVALGEPADAEDGVGVEDGAALAVGEVRVRVVFDVVHGTDDVRVQRPASEERVRREAVLGVEDVVWPRGAGDAGDELVDALADEGVPVRGGFAARKTSTRHAMGRQKDPPDLPSA